MAPVTGRITDAQQDRQVLCTRTPQGFFSPRVPVDRIVGMLKEVRAGFPVQTIGVFGFWGVRRSILSSVIAWRWFILHEYASQGGDRCEVLKSGTAVLDG